MLCRVNHTPAEGGCTATLPRCKREFALAAALSSVCHLPKGAPILVGAGRRRRPGAIARFCPPFGGQPVAIIRPDRLAAGLVPVNATLAGRDAWPLPIPRG